MGNLIVHIPIRIVGLANSKQQSGKATSFKPSFDWTDLLKTSSKTTLDSRLILMYSTHI